MPHNSFIYEAWMDMMENSGHCFCQMPACYTSTASNIRNLPITPGLLYLHILMKYEFVRLLQFAV